MRIKKLIKKIITFILHPMVFVYLRLAGARDFYIGSQMTINKLKYLKIETGVSIGRNSRFIFIKEYYGGKYNPSLRIGNNVSIGNRFSALVAARINIEDNCLIASDVLISSENHGTNPELTDSYADIPLVGMDVLIKKGCWIGEKVSIMPGVKLGERCIVAANAVVTKSFPAYSMIAGIPAKIIKRYNFTTHSWEENYDKE